MAPSPVGRFSFGANQSGPWLRRVRENARLLMLIHRARPSSANGAPIHLLQNKSGSARRAQSISFLLHMTLALSILLAVVFLRSYPPPHPWLRGPVLEFPLHAIPNFASVSAGRDGGGGNLNPVPATRGNLAPFSRVQLLPPRLPDGQQHSLVAPPTLQDDRAPDPVPSINNLGLPSAGAVTNSAGPGRNGIGNRGKNGMGDLDGDGNAVGDNGPYGPGVTPVLCAYCPDPPFTDEARKAKMQGTVLLRVLVGKDGRALDVRVVAPLGLGLDEQAVRTVRTWRFIPAKDAVRNPIASWVTVEAIFRLL